MRLNELMECYRTDPVSNFGKLEYCTRRYYTRLMAQIERAHGDVDVATIKGRTIHEWHQAWTDGGKKVSMGHALVGMLRTLTNFGFFALDDEACQRLALLLSKGRFANGKPRTVHITREQVMAICAAARAAGLPMVALACAIQFECTWRQKDVLGEWLPIAEPGISDVLANGRKWVKGLRWEEIDKDLIVHHVTSKRKKLSEPDLTLAPLVMAELEHQWPGCSADRLLLPASGPVIIDEYSGLPYKADDFREEWRIIATECGVPLNVQNRDARAGAISEAIAMGAQAAHVRDAATHSDVSQTMDYSRASRENTHTVQRMRMEKSSEKVA